MSFCDYRNFSKVLKSNYVYIIYMLLHTLPLTEVSEVSKIAGLKLALRLPEAGLQLDARWLEAGLLLAWKCFERGFELA